LFWKMFTPGAPKAAQAAAAIRWACSATALHSSGVMSKTVATCRFGITSNDPGRNCRGLTNELTVLDRLTNAHRGLSERFWQNGHPGSASIARVSISLVLIQQRRPYYLTTKSRTRFPKRGAHDPRLVLEEEIPNSTHKVVFHSLEQPSVLAWAG